MDAASGREVGRLQNPVLTHSFSPPPGTPLVFSSTAPRAQQLSGFRPQDATGSTETRLWETATGKTIGEAGVSALGQVAFHPDNRFLVTNDLRGVPIWDGSSGKIVASREMPEQVQE